MSITGHVSPKMPARYSHMAILLKRMAGTTRLELATSAVTGQRSNQLNYVPAARRSVQRSKRP